MLVLIKNNFDVLKNNFGLNSVSQDIINLTSFLKSILSYINLKTELFLVV